jgi:hypothetical protein
MQNKWSKVSNFCIERNNLYISRYVLANNANRYILWDGTKMIKISDNSQELKNYAMEYDKTQSSTTDRPSSIFGSKRDMDSRDKKEKKQSHQRSEQKTLGLFVS